MAAKKKIDLKNAWVTWVKIGFGVSIYALFASESPAPVGLVWGFLIGTSSGRKRATFLSMGSFVKSWARRSGVRSKINEYILHYADSVITPTGTRDGKKFMMASGYKVDPVSGFWQLGVGRRKK